MPAEPKAPAALCVDQGHKVPCLEHTYDYIDQFKAWAYTLKGKIEEIAGLQPKSEAK